MDFTNVLELLSGVALFLFGMTLMGEGLKKVAGSKLELVLYKLSSTPIKGILLGTGVTAVIQSSSATSVMVVGFVNSGMMKVRQAMGIIMGAIIGTSITGWVICLSNVGGSGSGSIWDILSTDTFTALMAVTGIILRMFVKNPKSEHLGDIMLGFAVLMYGISFMSDAVYPLRESQVFIDAIAKASNPILGILVGMVFTSIIQSASAAVGILQALAVTGAITFEVALPMIMGIAIGAAVPVLLSALGANANGKKTALTYLMVDAIGAILTAIIFYSINAFAHFNFMSTALSMSGIALMNTGFRIFIVILLAPFIGLLEKFVKLFVKDDEDTVDTSDIDKLEERFLKHPALALEHSRITIQAMADHTLEDLNIALGLVDEYSKTGFRRVEKLEEVVDRYEDKLGNYLVKIMENPLDNNENKIVSEYLHTLTDLERISDHALNIAECAKEREDRKIRFSDIGYRELSILISAVREVVSLSVEAVKNENLDIAQNVEPLEQVIDDLCDELKSHHIDRIGKGECAYEHGFVFNDILTNLERVSDHCSNLALAVIEAKEKEIDGHQYIESIKKKRGGDFQKKYKEYGTKYNLNI